MGMKPPKSHKKEGRSAENHRYAPVLSLTTNAYHKSPGERRPAEEPISALSPVRIIPIWSHLLGVRA